MFSACSSVDWCGLLQEQDAIKSDRHNHSSFDLGTVELCRSKVLYMELYRVFHGFRLSCSSSCPMNYFANVTDGADSESPTLL